MARVDRATATGFDSELERLRARARPWPKGHYFEDFQPGQEFHHHWGRTLTEADSLALTTLTQSYTPLYFNVDYARAHGHDGLVVNPMLVFLVTFGLSVEDLSEVGGAFLGVSDLVFHRHVYPGETIVAHSTVVAARPSRSRPEAGVVTWHSEGRSGEELVVDFHRSNLIRRRDTSELR